jgi:hypothetical protein
MQFISVKQESVLVWLAVLLVLVNVVLGVVLVADSVQAFPAAPAQSGYGGAINDYRMLAETYKIQRDAVLETAKPVIVSLTVLVAMILAFLFGKSPLKIQEAKQAGSRGGEQTPAQA